MRDLYLIGVHESGEFVVLGAHNSDVEYRLPLDDRFREAARWERSAIEAAQRSSRVLRPAEVQSLLRAGYTAEETAERAGWTEEKVHKFESPVLAERYHVARLASQAHVRGHSFGQGIELRHLVEEYLGGLGADSSQVRWDSRRAADGAWMVEVQYTADHRLRTATWRFSRSTMTVDAADEDARAITEEPAPGHEADGREPERAPEHSAYSPARREERHESEREENLVTSLRERSAARSRRRAPSPSSPQPVGEPVLNPGRAGLGDEAAPERIPAQTGLATPLPSPAHPRNDVFDSRSDGDGAGGDTGDPDDEAREATGTDEQTGIDEQPSASTRSPEEGAAPTAPGTARTAHPEATAAEPSDLSAAAHTEVGGEDVRAAVVKDEDTGQAREDTEQASRDRAKEVGGAPAAEAVATPAASVAADQQAEQTEQTDGEATAAKSAPAPQADTTAKSAVAGESDTASPSPAQGDKTASRNRAGSRRRGAAKRATAPATSVGDEAAVGTPAPRKPAKATPPSTGAAPSATTRKPGNTKPAAPTPTESTSEESASGESAPESGQPQESPRRAAPKSRSSRGRASVPSWDDIMFGSKPGGD